MEHVGCFNKTIKRMLKDNPSNKTLNTIEVYRKKKLSRDYYSMLDFVGTRVGLEFLVQPVFNESADKVTSYIPSIKIHPNKSKTGKAEIEELTEFKSIKKAYEYMAKEYVYRLMRIENLADFIN
jgi:hypothetical protein